MDVETLRSDPRTRLAEEFVTELRALYMKNGWQPREVHVNPGDDFLTRFATLKNMKVIKNHVVPLGKIILL